MEEKLYEAAITGNVEELRKIVKEDKLILHRVVVGRLNGISTPLHAAASWGHRQFVEDLLNLNPELAEVLDSQQRSALHLASAKGQVEIVRELTRVSPEMCLARDRDRANPVHVAAMKGKVEVLGELVRVNLHAARDRVDRGETILHLCVKHNQLKTLELLLDTIRCEEFANARDDAGNTVLHLAVADKKIEIIKHVLKNSKIDVNATNASKHTAMDILFLGQYSGKEPEELDRDIEDFLREANAKRAKDLVQGEWVTEKRAALMVVASLLATMAFQAGVNPPGGVWQEDSLNGHRAGEAVPPAVHRAGEAVPPAVHKAGEAHRAGEAVMAYNYPDSYPYFLVFNTIGFVASLTTILLLISGLPFKKKAFMWVLVVIMWLSITSMAVTYALAIVEITPKWKRKALSRTIVVSVIVWCGVMAILLVVHTVRLIPNFVEDVSSRIKAIKFGAGAQQALRQSISIVSIIEPIALLSLSLSFRPLSRYSASMIHSSNV